MKGFTEFKERITSDKAFAMKFANAENEAQVIAIARAEGYDLEQLSDEELDAVAAGGIFSWIKDTIENTCEFVGEMIVKPVVNTVVNGVETVVDGTTNVTETIINGADKLIKNATKH